MTAGGRLRRGWAALAATLALALLLAGCGGRPHGALSVTELHDLGQERYQRRSTLTGQVIPATLLRPPPGSRIDLVPIGPESAVVQLIDEENRVQPVLFGILDEPEFAALALLEEITVTGKVHPTGMYFADGVYIDEQLVPVQVATIPGLPA